MGKNMHSLIPEEMREVTFHLTLKCSCISCCGDKVSFLQDSENNCIVFCCDCYRLCEPEAVFEKGSSAVVVVMKVGSLLAHHALVNHFVQEHLEQYTVPEACMTCVYMSESELRFME